MNNNNNTRRLSNDVDMLASLLRECASIVEKSETSPLLFKAVEALNAYAESKSKNHTNDGGTSSANNAAAATATATATTPTKKPGNHHKPSFQRPINKQSNLISNGWVEQQRRSTLRMVWKQILLTLVEARRPGEDTTLWIQREAQKKQPDGGYKTTLEALHQIPMKWLLNVRYLDDYGDFRFCCKVYNVPDEFVFRTVDEEGCKEWVATLNSAREASQNSTNNGNIGQQQQQYNHHHHHSQQTFQEAGFPDLLSGKSADTMNSTSTTKTTSLFPDVNMRSAEKSPNQKKHQSTSSTTPKKKSLKELIAIAHGAGYNTRGMERADLEKIANHFAPASERKQQQQPSPPPNTNNTTNLSPEEIELAKAKAKAAQEEDLRRKQKAKQAEEESKLQEQIKNVKIQQETQRMERTKQMQQQFEQENQQRKERNDEVEKEEQRKRNEANQRAQQWEHPTAWPPPPPPAQHQHQQPQPSAPPFDQHQQQHHQQHHHQQQQFHQHRFNYHQQPQQQQYYPQQQQPRPKQSNGNGKTFSSERTADPTSPINQKYMKQMSNANITSKQDEETAISNLKRNILITWALIPPNYNMLKPINQLLSSIQIVFPPYCNVKQHEYFKTKWKRIYNEELVGSSNIPDETKLKKAHRKLRVFLHPDRLPKDFDVKQKFVCKMLWDVSNDAYEEFMKTKDDLDWVNTGR